MNDNVLVVAVTVTKTMATMAMESVKQLSSIEDLVTLPVEVAVNCNNQNHEYCGRDLNTGNQVHKQLN